jgi:predicted PurR-regulated permease PerM
MGEQPLDLPRTVLALLFMGALIAATFWVLRPFLTASIWAAMLVVATWPLMLRIQATLWGRRWLAVIVMTLLLLLLLFVPLLAAIGSMVSYAEVIASWARSLTSLTIPPLPGWMSRLPIVGPRLAEAWREFTASGGSELSARIGPFAVTALRWFLTHIGDFGITFVEFMLTILVAAILYSSGETVAAAVRRFARRIGGHRGEHSVVLAGQAIRGVALGVVVTALVQTLLGGSGLLVAGVPFTAVLTAVMFILTVAQIGPLPVMLPAVGWLYWMGESGWATGLLVWSFVPVATIDTVLRPFLIRRGADLPLLLILAGVIGGLISFGAIGIFVGPVVLAVTYELLKAWVGDEPPVKV